MINTQRDGWIHRYIYEWMDRGEREEIICNLSFFFFNLCLALELGKKKKIFPDREGA